MKTKLSENESVRDRLLGSLLGLAVGDALGTTLEFQSPGTFEPLSDMLGGGPFDLQPGQWTDDTSMMLCLAESLVSKQGFDPNHQMKLYLKWWMRGHWSSTGSCFDIGNTVREALMTYRRTKEPFSGSTHPSKAGNGSLMRLAPIPVFYHHDPAEAVRFAGLSSETTHAAPTCIDACRVTSRLMVRLFQGASKEEALQDLDEDLNLCPEIQEVVAGSYRRKDPPEIRGTGYVVESLEAALWAFATTDNFREGALRAVNLGDDADTTGAIFGQIAGACFGKTGIPEEWISKLARLNEMERLLIQLITVSKDKMAPHAG